MVSVTTAKFPEFWLPLRAMLLKVDIQIRKEMNALARRCESEGCGFESRCQQRGFFLTKAPLKCSRTIFYLFVKLVNYISVS